MKKNSFFLLLIIGLLVVFAMRYNYLPSSVVSNSDSQIAFSTKEVMLEQTWQPTAKIITGVSVPYYAENDFSCDVELKVFSDDYSKVIVNSVQKGYSFAGGASGTIDFSFDRTDVILGERYRIQISLLNPSAEGMLQIASGSNYGGCAVSGEETNQAAALTITFAKYSKIFWLVAALLPLVAYSLLTMLITGKKWEETVALSLFAEGIILYLFGLFDHLVWGINVVYVLAVLCLLAAIYLYNKKKVNMKDLLSPGLFVFLFMFCVIVVFSNGEWLSKRDDVKQWEIAARDMFFYDSFANHADTTVLLPRYLPFAAIIEYVFVYVNGIFAEDILLIAYQTMILSVLLILYKLLQKKGGMKLLIPIAVAATSVPVMFFNDVSSSIMVDALQAVIVAYALICYYTEEMSRFNRIRIASALVALTLIKDIGLIFSGMVALIMFGDMMVRQIKAKKACIKELIYPVMCVVLVLVTYLSWQLYLSNPAQNLTEPVYQETDSNEAIAIDEEESVTATAISASGITVDGLLAIFKGEGEPYQHQVTHNFFVELFDGETYPFGSLTLSFVDLLLVIAFLVVTLGYFGYWKEKKFRMYTFAGLSILASVCLCAFMLVMYWFTFSLYQALGLTSFSRYLAPYLCALIIVVFYFICDNLQCQQDKAGKSDYIVYVLAFVLAVSVPFSGIVVECNDREGYGTEDVIYGHSELAEILRSVAKRGERAYFICSNSTGYSEYIFRNTICPVVSDHASWNLVLSEEVLEEQYELYESRGDEDNVIHFLSVEEWKTELNGYEYVVVFHANELFRQSYAEVFENPEEIGDGSVYQVVNDKEDISLQLIGKTGIKNWQ